MLATVLRTAVENLRVFTVLVNTVGTASTLMGTRTSEVCALFVWSRIGGNGINYGEIGSVTDNCCAVVDRGGL